MVRRKEDIGKLRNDENMQQLVAHVDIYLKEIYSLKQEKNILLCTDGCNIEV